MSNPDHASPQAIVDGVITARRSVRRFLPDPIAEPALQALLTVAARAPSGSNTQPWRVHVLTGEALTDLSAAILSAYNDPQQAAQAITEPGYYPDQWFEPYQARRRALGLGLYELLGIGKADKARMHAQQGRNYAFFDAPVGMIFTIDRRLGHGSWLDCGMFIQTLMLAAKARGWDTCAQAAFNAYHAVIARQLALPEHERVVCGLALGWADPQAIENTLVSAREPIEGFASFHR